MYGVMTSPNASPDASPDVILEEGELAAEGYKPRVEELSTGEQTRQTAS